MKLLSLRNAVAVCTTLFLAVLLVVMFCPTGGCNLFAPTTQPTTQPGLTPDQQNAINFALTVQNEIDLANGVFQAVAATNPALAADATTAQQVTTTVNLLIGQYIADVTAGTVPPATLWAQIDADVAQVMSIVAESPQASQAFVAAKAQRAKLAAPR